MSSEESQESKIGQVRQIFQELYEAWDKAMGREKKVKDVRAVIETLIAAGILEERAARNLQILFDPLKAVAYIESDKLKEFITRQRSSTLKEISNWLLEKMKEAGCINPRWCLDSDGIAIEIITTKEQGVETNQIPSTILKKIHRELEKKDYKSVIPAEIDEIFHQMGFQTGVGIGNNAYLYRATKNIAKEGTAEAYLQIEVFIDKLSSA